MRYVLLFSIAWGFMFFATRVNSGTNYQDVKLPTELIEIENDKAPKPTVSEVISEFNNDEWYVVESDEPLVIIHSPTGLLNVQQDVGPIRVRGKFADGIGQIETRQFNSPYVYFIEPMKSGTTELIIIPSMVNTKEDIIRQKLTVVAMPNPPPIDPVDPVDPIDPVDPVDPPTGIMVLMLFNEDANREQLSTINSTEIISWMNENCAKDEENNPQWRKWDRTSLENPDTLINANPVWKKLWNDVKSKLTPGNLVLVITDTQVHVMPMVGPTDTLKFLNKVKAGK